MCGELWVRERVVCVCGRRTGQGHGNTSQKERLGRVSNHGRPDAGVENVSGGRDEARGAKEEGVEAEKGIGQVGDPGGRVGQLVEEDGDDAGAHAGSEPSAGVGQPGRYNECIQCHTHHMWCAVSPTTV